MQVVDFPRLRGEFSLTKKAPGAETRLFFFRRRVKPGRLWVRILMTTSGLLSKRTGMPNVGGLEELRFMIGLSVG